MKPLKIKGKKGSGEREEEDNECITADLEGGMEEGIQGAWPGEGGGGYGQESA